MSDAALLFEQVGPVGWIILNRPKAMNAINLAMIAAYEELLPQVAGNNDIRVLAITGQGPAFCAGADLKELLASSQLSPGEPDFIDLLTDRVINPLRDYPKPVIAALNGITMAGGLETALCADIVLAADSARIGDAHANYGVYPGAGGAAVLPRIVPLNVAKYLLFTGKTLSAEEMKAYGFVNQVVSADALREATQSLAEEIAAKSPIALRRMKEVANTAGDKSRHAALQHELVMFRKHMRSYDANEGLKAFSEKRPPCFKGY
ncbi:MULTISPECIES: enoyl-CoA hydratase/isomerase family protein [Pseudomonadaceae]|uniref:Enoyl-CoA hydratase/isomerase family protein n=1 Tax=Stutzerimonas chloritidismutans TaxID=203192 RepID=A0ACC5VPK0_STUCH|nr:MULTISPECIES: enoyl-CoA hydratase/isomerase family protein [Pseudomonadaceae]MBT1079828.1 enoyl-CoA hydratase/isomerase family protein [Pseudomonas aeruginosa]MBX7274274.1 enoyl-CoA hydratase/isomerase family protein [Stutzerimonas chloritidismutans]MCS7968332.1 enoyl-CoA hydratase/isomerase family protein [Pseudomonas aeruginosa]MCS8136982.1 enoyl-CoA hydratase/isomerase family protein [Pseudomonas aeruginosa]MCS8179013.1 enoyl-CoA hydratase/isomerase family protein [Pseudomonas aeruginosa